MTRNYRLLSAISYRGKNEKRSILAFPEKSKEKLTLQIMALVRIKRLDLINLRGEKGKEYLILAIHDEDTDESSKLKARQLQFHAGL